VRIVVDLQSCQNGSRLRGIGRYALAMTRALIEVAGDRHEILVALSDRFPGTIDPIRRELAGLMPTERIVVFHLPHDVAGAEPGTAWRSQAAEALREHFLAGLKPDMVFLPSLFEGFHDDCVTSIGRQDIPTAVAVHDLIPLLWPQDYVSQTDERACYNRKLLALKRADLWLAVSDHSRREACELLDLPEDRVVVTLEAVEPRFKPAGLSKAKAQDLLSSLGLTRPFVMFTSAVELRKNVDGLIRAFGRLPEDVRRAHQLALIGSADDWIRNRLGETIREAGLSDDEVVFTGRVDDQQLIGLYSLCRQFVFPSFHEGFGLPILEAMACGAPVIGSNVSSVPEVIGLEEALFDPRDVDAMAGLIGKALSAPAFRNRLIAHGKKRAKAFSWAASARTALAGMEAAHKRHVEAAPPDARGRRPRLAWVCDLPPEDTAPAARAERLLPELGRRYDIELVCDQPEVRAPWLTANFPVRSRLWFLEQASRFDRVVYDLGARGGALDLMAEKPGLILLDRLYTDDARNDLDDADFQAWLVETQGLDAAVIAATCGRQAAAAAFPLMAEALETAAGVVLLSDGLRDEAVAALGAEAAGWPRLDLPGASPREAADRLAEVLETAFRSGPPVRLQRLLDDIGASCAAGPSEEDLAAAARCLAANSRPLGRPRLLLDISAVSGLPPAGRARRLALGRIANLLRGSGRGRRVEPVYATVEGYRHAWALAAEALGLDGVPPDDAPLAARAGDALLALAPPAASDLARLRELQDEGVRLLCLAGGEAALARAMQASEIGGLIDAWIAAVGKRGAAGALWLSPQAPGRPAAAAAVDDRSTHRLERAWGAGLELHALMIGPPSAGTGDLGERAVEWPTADAALDAVRLAAGDPKAPARAASALNWTVAGHVLGAYSLALINRAVARALADAAPGRVRLLPWENRPVETLEGVPEPELAEMEELARAEPPQDGLNVAFSQHYPVWVPPGEADLRLALFAWEEYGVPAETLEALSRFDAVLATSRFTARALIDSGFGGTVVSIGQPANLKPFLALAPEPRAPQEPFTFLHVSSGFPRKGVDALLAAWARAFRKGDPVRLVLKTFPNAHNRTAEQVEALFSADPDVAEIELIERELGEAELVDLYRRADAAVYPTRGEGYNLPALEAMAAGIPLIVTGHGGHLDFLSPREARLVRWRLAPSQSHVATSDTLWAEPDLDDLVSALREMADPDQRPLAKARAARARRSAVEAASPERWAGALDATARAVLARADGVRSRVGWVTTWDVRCGIAEYSRRLLDAFSPDLRRETAVICDVRTPPGRQGGFERFPSWTIGKPPAWTGVLDALAAAEAEVVVIQHQDGLLPWPELAELIPALAEQGRMSVVILHNAAKLPLLEPEEIEMAAWALRRADRVLVHNLADLNYLLGLGVQDNLALLPHGAHAARSRPSVRELDGWAAQPLIGCHGFFLPGKGVDRLIEAFALLRRTWPKARLRLVNARFPADVSDWEIDRCRDLAARLGVADGVEWLTDFLAPEEILDRLRECDLVVLPYEPRTDSASGAVRLALSSLAPVAVTPVAIFDELGEAVARLASGEPADMARSIEVLLRDSRRRRDVQARAADWLASRDWGAVGARLEGMLRGLVQSRALQAAVERRSPEASVDQIPVIPALSP
jgi:glycosyltransferase involved in cell wall biosynthesis